MTARAPRWRKRSRSLFALAAIGLAHAAVIAWAVQHAPQDPRLSRPASPSSSGKTGNGLVWLSLVDRTPPRAEPLPFSLALNPPPLPEPSALTDSPLSGGPSFLDSIQWPDFSALGPGFFSIQADFGNDGLPREIKVLSESWRIPSAAEEIRQLAMRARAPRAGIARVSFVIDPAASGE